jgi:5-formyltetrahydrofolate cyclo-ligase
MVIVPLLAFDKKGYRVGYGKGFYDRFLANIETQKVGLSFFEPIEEINDVHLNDIRLDQCITPNGIINFKN